MKIRLPLHAFLLALLSAGAALAYPPAPFHRIYGMVRDDHGNPLGASDAVIILSGEGNAEIVRGPSDTALGIGVNYSLSVPMDTGVLDQLYKVTALRPTYPFTIRVIRGGASYVPIQMQGTSWKVGDPAGSTRIDLTLGLDSDGDGLPDAWEKEVIRTDTTGKFKDLSQIKPSEDIDGDGLSNLQEYIAGTYALDSGDGLFLSILSVSNGYAHLQFLTIAKRSYRLKSSVDLATFSAQPFALAPADASLLLPGLLARDTKLMDVYVPVGNAPGKSFRLYVD